jgi:hypothetical protein
MGKPHLLLRIIHIAHLPYCLFLKMDFAFQYRQPKWVQAILLFLERALVRYINSCAVEQHFAIACFSKKRNSA